MNQFQSIESGAGILKKDYESSSPQIEALKRRRAKLTDQLTTSTALELESEPKLGD